LAEAQLGIGLWQGSYQGVERLWLRWYDRNLNWILTPEEHERQRANMAELELAKLRSLLLSRGIDFMEIE
jgi:hypothetical protein